MQKLGCMRVLVGSGGPNVGWRWAASGALGLGSRSLRCLRRPPLGAYRTEPVGGLQKRELGGVDGRSTATMGSLDETELTTAFPVV